MKNEYLIVLRGHLEGIRVSSWHKVTEDEAETKAVVFGMFMSSKMNMGSGVLKITSEEEWTPELLEAHLRSLSAKELKAFIQEASCVET